MTYFVSQVITSFTWIWADFPVPGIARTFVSGVSGVHKKLANIGLPIHLWRILRISCCMWIEKLSRPAIVHTEIEHGIVWLKLRDEWRVYFLSRKSARKFRRIFYVCLWNW